jgi:hypothetical protein
MQHGKQRVDFTSHRGTDRLDRRRNDLDNTTIQSTLTSRCSTGSILASGATAVSDGSTLCTTLYLRPAVKVR